MKIKTKRNPLPRFEKRRNDSEDEDFGRNDDDDDDFDFSNVDKQNNKIYFYSEVERGTVLSLNKSLRSIDDNITNLAHKWGLKELPAIHLYINSNGGLLFSGLAAVDYIRSTRAPVYSYIDGSAASAATLMSIVAKRRFINRNSFMLIHQMSGGSWGTYHQMKDEFENNEKLMKTIKTIYLKYTKIPEDFLDEILKHDLWLDAETCLKYGLVDEVIE